MITSSKLIRELRRQGTVSFKFQFPYLHVALVSERFADLTDNEREAILAGSLDVSIDEFRKVQQNGLLIVELLAPNERVALASTKSRGTHWLPEFLNATPATSQPLRKTIHFYGYKGGQARSTVLAMFSRELADAGFRVLAVDADIEAPSLNVIYGRNASGVGSTLLGFQNISNAFSSENVYRQTMNRGVVDAIFCRPQEREFDIDATAFALRSSIAPVVIESIADRIDNFARDRDYDVVLIDHRSGLSPVIIPWIKKSPGPVCVFTKLDEQWTPAKSFISVLLRNNPDNPGLFISWQPDDENTDQFITRNLSQIDSLLELLAQVIQTSNGSTDEVYASDVRDHWLLWPYHSAFREKRLPDSDILGARSREVLTRLTSLIQLPSKAPDYVTKQLTISGTTDESSLIQTDAIRELSAYNSPIRFVLGRKGTGKSRLLRYLADRDLGWPLLVDASDESGRGLKSGSPDLLDAATRYNSEPIKFWMHFVSAALNAGSVSRTSLLDSFRREVSDFGNEDLGAIIKRLPSGPKRTFLIDGIETAFRGRQINRFVDGLFATLLAGNADPRLLELVDFRVFLRTDMIGTVQNAEQQLAGKTIRLSWDTKTILNFVLSRIEEIDWFKVHFSDAVQRIASRTEEITLGALSIEECEDLLLLIFPSKLRRNNLFTKTFLKTYFADSASERGGIDSSLRYYPRIFAQFLEYISDPGKMNPGSFTGAQLEDDRVSQRLIFAAHEAAANDYLDQIKAELVYLLEFEPDIPENSVAVGQFLSAFNGMQTPFDIQDVVDKLSGKLKMDEARIRQAMERMRSVGIFEYRSDYETEWRVGRLFKSSLRMKYNRGPRVGFELGLIDDAGELIQGI